VCGYVQDRDIAATEVMLYWAIIGNLPGLGTSLVDADDSGSTSNPRQRAGSMRQLGQMKRQKSNSAGVVVETHPSTK